ncbi:uncharacterized protein LOC124297684 [Neodiprion virginianus]|uniref:uncharacterized protein LOC124297684 n=1 Tax=Neodiprion virginianus TaxID=2961670 RepID=UPI001EE748CB|nr:uncharacterized protein LOC124297684 [Neodiprion virginianus]
MVHKRTELLIKNSRGHRSVKSVSPPYNVRCYENYCMYSVEQPGGELSRDIRVTSPLLSNVGEFACVRLRVFPWDSFIMWRGGNNCYTYLQFFSCIDRLIRDHNSARL